MAALWRIKTQMGCCYGYYFASPCPVEVNFLFGKVLSETQLCRGAVIKKSNEAGFHLPREPWTKNVGRIFWRLNFLTTLPSWN
jgi:hypothetical protein